MKIIYIFSYLIILFSILYGFKRGFLKEIYSCFFFIIFYFLINKFFLIYYNYLNLYIKKYNFLWFFLIFFIFIFCYFLEKYSLFLLKNIFFNFILFLDKILGILFGLLRGILIIYIINSIYIILLKNLYK